MYINDRDKVAIVNRYYGGTRALVLAEDYKLQLSLVFEVIKSTPPTHYVYCNNCLSSRIHQDWCDIAEYTLE